MVMIRIEDKVVAECKCVIVIPEKAVEEAGYIQLLSGEQDGGSKHEFHALSQMAFYQYQDDELPVEYCQQPIGYSSSDIDENIHSGVLLYRSSEDTIHIIAHDGVNVKKLLEAAFRFCTRWVRLDI